jgi:hypothetical protein
MKVYTTIDIASSPAKVWEVLTTFSAYSEWNPFLVSASGDAVVGSRLHTSFNSGMNFAPKVMNFLFERQTYRTA